MKKLICLIFTIIAMAAVITAPAASTAASSEGSVTGIGTGSFAGRPSFAGVNLSRFEIATGIFTEADGSAAGVFHAVLTGRSVLGAAQNITLEGNVTQGFTTAGSGGLSGLATLDLGNGIPAASGVPFIVQTNGGSMVLTIGSTVLPAATFSEGGLNTE
jgi:hypothetical protein